MRKLTDLEHFVRLYRDFGIECSVNTEQDGSKTIYLQTEKLDKDSEITYSDKFCGYEKYFTSVVFDENGKFISQGFWEDIGG